jgi:hypothetical protein
MASQCSGNKNKPRTFAYNFNKNGRISNSSSVLITNVFNIYASVTVIKKCNVDQNFMTMH